MTQIAEEFGGLVAEMGNVSFMQTNPTMVGVYSDAKTVANQSIKRVQRRHMLHKQIDFLVSEAETRRIPDEFAKLPALSIRQPWAWAILNVGKDIENRSWPTRFRGRFLIHAAKGCTRDEYLDAKSDIGHAVAPEFRGKGIVFPGWKDMERGGIVGVAEIVDCVSQSDSRWFGGQWGFVLKNVQRLDFFPCKGVLGFFRIPQHDQNNESKKVLV